MVGVERRMPVLGAESPLRVRYRTPSHTFLSRGARRLAWRGVRPRVSSSWVSRAAPQVPSTCGTVDLERHHRVRVERAFPLQPRGRRAAWAWCACGPLPAPWGQRPANNVRVVACRVVEMLTVEIEGCPASHTRLATRIEGLTDEAVREPSLLPAWSVGHVLTHLARNAEAMFHRIEATTCGEVIDQYVGGAEGRASAIESGAGRPANVLINDVISWSQRLDATFVSLPDDLRFPRLTDTYLEG